MATYKKRGHKGTNKAEATQQEIHDSTTAEVFSSLDTGASRTEQWVARNQTYILGVIGVVAVAVLGYLGYEKLVQEPREASASNELFFPMQYFQQAQQNESQADSLYTLALNGAEGKYGLLDIMDNFSGTKAANLATYAAGISYLHLDQYDQAIDYLEDFKSDDAILGSVGEGAIGDAFMELGQGSDALDYYEKAIAHDTNAFTTPLYLHKAGITALQLEEYGKALKFFTRIKEEFPQSAQASGVEAYIGMAQKGN
ncbi:tetratricopeptide repeat protein [Robiginitalea sp. M366]|uniref:tetratricopeptide repeat protein n=1 Tax=Robiginitalea aestuariiviva TaxID=3036903 RepID=UPI00240DA9AC|nr:tetratricopeptide repeat protein [Robiginitalea aestuariiviva]MDG1573244.1 tetratricopeptide repeat protein [Robiginitalea aestuariiviva]